MRALLVAVGALLPLMGVTPAGAQEGKDEPSVSAGEDAFDATFSQENEGTLSSSDDPEAASADGTQVTYSLDPMCVPGAGGPSGAYYGCAQQEICGDDGLRFWVWQHSAGASQIVGSTCVEEGEDAPQAVLTPARILEAFRRIPVPSPSIGVNPPGGRTLVNFDTILHTQAEPFTETVRLLGRSVTFDITPSEFTWSTGQGEFSTSDPGQPYREALPMSAYVTHRYLEAGTESLGLATTWTARWRVGDGPWQPVDGTVTTTSEPVPLEVVTARPQLVSYD